MIADQSTVNLRFHFFNFVAPWYVIKDHRMLGLRRSISLATEHEDNREPLVVAGLLQPCFDVPFP